MDGTLCDYQGTLKEKLEFLLGEEASIHDPKYKNLVDLIKSTDGFWRNLPIIESGMHVVNLLTIHGFQVNILTKGPYRTVSAWTEKVEWCRKHLPDIPVTITEDKSLTYGKILFDDWPPYCRGWIKYRPRGLVLMPAYHYNEEFAKEFPTQVVRVTGDNWDEVEAAIKRAADRLPGEDL